MTSAIRGPILTFTGDPFMQDLANCLRYEPDAVIVMDDGHFATVGPADAILPTVDPDVRIDSYPDNLIIPGFVDCHVHYPQTEIIASHGEKLIDWLDAYVFPAEARFSDLEHAHEIAEVFIREQLRNGVTTSTVFGTVHPGSVEALFEVAGRYGMRLQAGKVCMDRNAPEGLLDTPQRAYDESKMLIDAWHGKGRLEYAITPRFAPTSTPEQLEAIGALASEFPDLVIQSHLAENCHEVEWAMSLFPDRIDYTDIYDHYGLMRPRAVYGHGIHLTDRELGRIAEAGAAIAHCPTSNFFLGSGAFDLFRAKAISQPVRVGIGTDIGAGTSFSMLRTLDAAYKAAQLHDHALPATHALYLATRGGAEALGLQDRIGSIAVGHEADLAVLDLTSTPLIEARMRHVDGLEDALFIQMVLGDDRAIAATYVAGTKVHIAMRRLPPRHVQSALSSPRRVTPPHVYPSDVYTGHS